MPRPSWWPRKIRRSSTSRTSSTPRATGSSHDHDRNHGPTDFDFGVGEDPHRHAGSATTATTTTTTTNPTKGTTGVSGAEGPLDPYNSGGEPTADPGDGAAPEKKAEFFANLGEQQLASSDTVGAAASFQKATQLDPKNIAAVIGMGAIALRQGLFGDAIAHLKKAARMAPKSSRVFTLLGEALSPTAARTRSPPKNFKKALQLDPDNASRARGLQRCLEPRTSADRRLTSTS